MSQDEEREELNHSHRRAVPYTPDEAMAALQTCITHHITYPQSDAVQTTVTLTDEEWNAVATAVSMVMIAENTENNARLPDFIMGQMHQALHAIHDACESAIEEHTVDTLRESLDDFLDSLMKGTGDDSGE